MQEAQGQILDRVPVHKITSASGSPVCGNFLLMNSPRRPKSIFLEQSNIQGRQASTKKMSFLNLPCSSDCT